MTSVVWENLLLALPFVLVFAGIPLMLVNKRPDRAPDFSEAHAYLRAKSAMRKRPTPAGAAAVHERAARQDGPRERVLVRT